MTKLNYIPVRFDQEAHTYTNTETGEVYKGITGTLIHHLFPNKYKNIPKDVLQKAADRGSLVHEDIELVETLGATPTTEEGRNYLRLKAENGLVFLASEHLVSDLRGFATNIDMVYDAEEQTDGKDAVDITDFKTTSKFDKESVSWQLSICAYFLEQNNPHVRVRECFGIWLRGDIAEKIAVERHSNAEVMALIKAYESGEAYEYRPEFPDYIMENEQTLHHLGKRIKQLTEEYDRLKGEVLRKMAENGDKTFDTGNMIITRVAAQTRRSFDSKAFKKDFPEQYEAYTRETETSESLKITIR